MVRTVSILVVSILAFMANPTLVKAHGLGGDCHLKLLIEAFFDDGSDAADAKVLLFDAKDQKVAEGKTDAKGQCYLPLPAPGQYRYVIDAGAGHRFNGKVTVPGAATPVDETPITNREEMMRGLWLRAGIGVGVIGVFAGAAWLAVRRKAVA